MQTSVVLIPGSVHREEQRRLAFVAWKSRDAEQESAGEDHLPRHGHAECWKVDVHQHWKQDQEPAEPSHGKAQSHG